MFSQVNEGILADGYNECDTVLGNQCMMARLQRRWARRIGMEQGSTGQGDDAQTLRATVYLG